MELSLQPWCSRTVDSLYDSRKAALLNTVDKEKCLGDSTLFQASRESFPSQQYSELKGQNLQVSGDRVTWSV